LRFLEREKRRKKIKKQQNSNWVVVVVWGIPNYEQEFVADLSVSNLFLGFWKRWELWELLLVGRGRRARAGKCGFEKKERERGWGEGAEEKEDGGSKFHNNYK